MRRQKVRAAGIAVAAALAAGCAGSAAAPHAVARPAASAPVLTTDGGGQSCPVSSLTRQGYCPGDGPVSDPDGMSCPAQALDSRGYCPGDEPAGWAPPATVTPQVITFRVNGASSAQVSYGPAGTSVTGKSPMSVSQDLVTPDLGVTGSSPLYYALTAQLQGSGTVTVAILVDGQVISQGTASGGYGIALAEISPDPVTGGWRSDTGS